MNINELNIFLDCIVGSSKAFLENDINVEVLNISECKYRVEDKYSALISFSGQINFFYLITLDRELLQSIFKVMVPLELSSEEKEEMMNSLSEEIINTVAGFAISSFQKKYEDLIMSVPLVLNNEILETFETNDFSASKRIETDFGDLVCTIIP